MPRLFHLIREEDESGVSGVGVVAEGVVLCSGRVVLEWLVPPFSMGIYQTIGEVLQVHGHEGRTRISYLG